MENKQTPAPEQAPEIKEGFFLRRPIFSTVISLIITLVGAIAISVLPVEQYPDLTPPHRVLQCGHGSGPGDHRREQPGSACAGAASAGSAAHGRLGAQKVVLHAPDHLPDLAGSAVQHHLSQQLRIAEHRRRAETPSRRGRCQKLRDAGLFHAGVAQARRDEPARGHARGHRHRLAGSERPVRGGPHGR